MLPSIAVFPQTRISSELVWMANGADLVLICRMNQLSYKSALGENVNTASLPNTPRGLWIAVCSVVAMYRKERHVHENPKNGCGHG